MSILLICTIKEQIHETKTQTIREVHYTQVVNWLNKIGKPYFTYQLRSAKGLRVNLNRIDSSSVHSDEIKQIRGAIWHSG